jgi:hypothetical protein
MMEDFEYYFRSRLSSLLEDKREDAEDEEEEDDY